MFDRAFDIILKVEGGYSDDPRDPGGKTRYGITEAVARQYGYRGDIRNLPLDVAKTIYRRGYWDACLCDQLPWPLSCYVFDCAVNQGPDVARRLLQAALDTTQDGHLGPTTIRLAKQSNQWHWHRFMALRAMRYGKTQGFDRFGLGWLIRLFEVVKEANNG